MLSEIKRTIREAEASLAKRGIIRKRTRQVIRDAMDDAIAYEAMLDGRDEYRNPNREHSTYSRGVGI